ncbi:response regulator [Candidatus Enterenecus avicola]
MNKYQVLVVDDEEISADGISEIIRQNYRGSLETMTLYSSTQALDYLKENPVDLLITDINMPKLSGIDLIKEIQAIDPEIRIVILTGFGSLTYAQKAMRFGVKHFLQKPAFPDQILESIQDVLKEITERERHELLNLRHLSEQILLGKTDYPFDKSLFLWMISSADNQRIGEALRHFFEKEKVPYVLGEINPITQYYFSSETDACKLIGPIQKTFSDEHFTIVVLKNAKLSDLTHHYQKGIAYIQWNFYYPDEKVVMLDEFPYLVTENQRNSKRQLDGLEHILQEKDNAKALSQLESFFQEAIKVLLPVKLLKQWLLQKFSKVFVENGKSYLEIADFEKKLRQTQTFLELRSLVMMQIKLINQADTFVSPVEKISVNLNRIIDKYYAESELSLKWISQNLLFLNAEHLGRTYLKETGEKFSHHLQAIRMLKAKDLLESGYKVYEVADMTGYRENPDYFSKLFKKTYGKTPNQVLKRSES